mgnify:CR=1 FL=1
MAQVRSIRAWAYLQLALNYGKVPFYTEPLLTEQDADDVSLDVKDRKDIEAICDYFINDLKPYSNTPWPALHKVGSLFMANCYFPVDVVLGDLYLWKALAKGRMPDVHITARLPSAISVGLWTHVTSETGSRSLFTMSPTRIRLIG